ncbi:MAG TPA: TadE/TadG family type IV pilus assembly protein [Gemmataceae bacterium]|nr:TadE/TadG family type IV pilus assembly protein [Gemmataceae bacterium]
MIYRNRDTGRRGALILECALVYPITFLLVFGLIIGGLGVFRYQEVASLAREGSRYASLHGAAYAQATGKNAATAADVYNNAILPKAVALKTSELSYSVAWNPDNTAGSTVSVTVTYHWVPEAFLPSMNLSSTSTVTMIY